MHEQVRRCFAALASLGLISAYGSVAAAQEIIEETYTVEEISPDEMSPPDVALDDDEEREVIIADRDAMAQCAATFRSFDPATGTYVTYAGDTVRCPYLE